MLVLTKKSDSKIEKQECFVFMCQDKAVIKITLGGNEENYYCHRHALDKAIIITARANDAIKN